VRRAVAAKRTHPPSPDFWFRLAALANLTAAIIDNPNCDLGQRLDQSDQLLGQLMDDLPTPNVALWDPRSPGPWWSARWRGCRPLADLADCMATLAAVLRNPQLVGVRALAILLDEHAITLWICRRKPLVPNPRIGIRGVGRAPPPPHDF
jgi:hypothetical protein